MNKELLERLAKKIIKENKKTLLTPIEQLRWAISRGSYTVMKYSVQYVSLNDIGESLGFAAECGHLEIVKYLSTMYKEDAIGSEHYSDALLFATEYGHLEIVKYLSSFRICYGYYRTAIEFAIMHGRLNILKYFIDINGSIKLSNDDWFVTRAVKNGHLEIIKYLVSTMIIDVTKSNVILHALRHGNLGVVKYLVSIAGTSIIKEKYKAMLRAIQFGDTSIVEYLVSIGLFSRLLNPYKYFHLLDSRHLQWITDNDIKRIINNVENRKKILHNERNYVDVLIIVQ